MHGGEIEIQPVRAQYDVRGDDAHGMCVFGHIGQEHPIAGIKTNAEGRPESIVGARERLLVPLGIFIKNILLKDVVTK